MEKTIALHPEEGLLNLLEAGEADCKPFRICRHLSEYVSELIRRNAESEMLSCIGRVYSIYRTSTKELVRTAIENVFIYSMGASLMINKERRELLYKLPVQFRNILTRQIMSSGK